MAELISEQWKIFDHLLDAVFIVDRDGKLFYTNESFRHLCDAPLRAVTSHEEAVKYIELPEECWEPLRESGDSISDSAGYREVGFITKSGSMGRAQVFTDRIRISSLSSDELFYVILRDVTVEARLHAKYKVQIDNNERLIGDLQRSLSETAFLRRLATELPIYTDTGTLLSTIANRMKTELSFRDAHFFTFPDPQTGEIEPFGLDKRMGSRLREVAKFLGPALKEKANEELVTSVVFQPFGLFWITYFRPRLERPVVLVASTKPGEEGVDHRILLEALSGQVSTLLDNRSLYFASITDTVTGLFNRRFFDSRFGIECMRATEKRMPLTLLLIDIDHFKKINDDHGHQAGDAVLNTLGQVIKRRIRGSDIGARVGGEEFAVVLPDTSPIDALIVAENLRKQVSEMNVAVHGLNKEIKVTISIGVAGYKWATDNQNSLYKHAEEALERAKADGRNKIISAEPPAA